MSKEEVKDEKIEQYAFEVLITKIADLETRLSNSEMALREVIEYINSRFMTAELPKPSQPEMMQNQQDQMNFERPVPETEAEQKKNIFQKLKGL